MEPTPADAVHAIHEVFGCHRGARAAHATGTICHGVFTPTAHAKELTRARHMRADSVPVTVRFSNASGDPEVPDGGRDAHGMAVRFHLRDGEWTDIVAVTLPCFFVSSPADFVKLNKIFRRKRPGAVAKPRLLKLVRFLASHRDAIRPTLATMFMRPAHSYAHLTYRGLHAFRWINKAGEEHYVRYVLTPEEGERRALLGPWRERDYMQRDLYERLGRIPENPFAFKLEAQIASQEDWTRDRVFNPARPWPDKRKGKITPAGAEHRCKRFLLAGMIELTGLDDQRRRNGDTLSFDPTHMVDGIEAPTDRDAILGFRARAYEHSFRQRTGKTPYDCEA